MVSVNIEIVEHWRNSPWVLKGKVREYEEKGYIAFHKLQFGERIEIDDIGVTPFRGNHTGNVKENSAMYLVELPDGRNLFYGLDSGVYFPETVEALRKHHVDIYISENAMGAASAIPHPEHMRMVDVRELVGKLLEQGTLDKNSVLYLTHINHRSTHVENENAVEEIGFPVKTIVAYDGIKIL